MNADGTPHVRRVNDSIPHNVITSLLYLQFRDGLSLPDATGNIRGSLIPAGYTPWPFKRDTPESVLDMLRSIVATYEFRATVNAMYEEYGADFKQHLYVPEKDPVTLAPIIMNVETTIMC